jgi:hypothetical protein
MHPLHQNRGELSALLSKLKDAQSSLQVPSAGGLA